MENDDPLLSMVFNKYEEGYRVDCSITKLPTEDDAILIMNILEDLLCDEGVFQEAKQCQLQ